MLAQSEVCVPTVWRAIRTAWAEAAGIGSLIGRRLLYVIDYDHIDPSLRRFEFET